MPGVEIVLFPAPSGLLNLPSCVRFMVEALDRHWLAICVDYGGY
jgi:hypothetical protein